MTDNTTTDPAPVVWACLNYTDAPAAIDFLVALGFRSTLTVPGEGMASSRTPSCDGPRAAA